MRNAWRRALSWSFVLGLLLALNPLNADGLPIVDAPAGIVNPAAAGYIGEVVTVGYPSVEPRVYRIAAWLDAGAGTVDLTIHVPTEAPTHIVLPASALTVGAGPFGRPQISLEGDVPGVGYIDITSSASALGPILNDWGCPAGAVALSSDGAFVAAPEALTNGTIAGVSIRQRHQDCEAFAVGSVKGFWSFHPSVRA